MTFLPLLKQMEESTERREIIKHFTAFPPAYVGFLILILHC